MILVRSREGILSFIYTQADPKYLGRSSDKVIDEKKKSKMRKTALKLDDR